MTWGASEIISGAPPGADADPNVTPPIASRIIESPHMQGNRLPKVILWAVGGTSIPVTVYAKDETVSNTAPWIPLAASITVITGVTSTLDVPPNAKLFFRNGAAVGAVTSRGAAFV